MDENANAQVSDEFIDRGVTAGRIHALIIAGQIEGHFAAAPQAKSTKYEQCIPTLFAVEESEDIDGLLLLINTIIYADGGSQLIVG